MTRFQRPALVALAAVWLEVASFAQGLERNRPPPILKSAGGFSAARLTEPPPIDGREWMAANVQTSWSADTVPAVTHPVAVPTREYSLTLTDCGDHGGDLERCQLLFHRARTTPLRIDTAFTAWVFVTPDGRYIITEPLYVLDVREWKQYALFDALQIPNYTTIEAISRDGRRLVVSRRGCAIDCKGVPVEYFELRFP